MAQGTTGRPPHRRLQRSRRRCRARSVRARQCRVLPGAPHLPVLVCRGLQRGAACV